ncbi:MAG: ribonuclease T [Gammaproteobacteria bacterium]|nr:MAG: ribonuclease T [Gammaproteobacteria bacterium]
MSTDQTAPLLATRFRSFLPIVIDVETGGFNAATDALLEIAAVIISADEQGKLYRSETFAFHVQPFPGAILNDDSLAVNGIKPFHPLRPAIEEHDAITRIFQPVRAAIKHNMCTRAILVGHNPALDLNFLNAAVARNNIKRNPFHPFSTFDTATLAGLAYGQTVLSRAVHAAGFDWDDSRAHAARYDAERTAELFCEIVNRWDDSLKNAALTPPWLSTASG